MKTKRLLGSLALVALVSALAWTFLGSRRSASGYQFERQPRAVLASLGVKAAKKPKLAVSASGALYMLAVYGDEGSERLGLSMSHDGGDTFSPMAPASKEGARVSSHGENGPSLAVMHTGTYALWQQTTKDGRSEIMCARAPGMGHSFEEPISIVDKQTPSFNGFSSLAAAPNGDVYAVWLDGRDPAEPKGTFAVYLAKSTDRGASFSRNLRVALGACPCCRPAIAAGRNGEVYVSWRKVYPGDVRDVVVATSYDSGQTFSEPVRVAGENWVLHACPESGPALVSTDTGVMVAWHGEGSGKPGIRLALSKDSGKSFGPVVMASGTVLDADHPALSRSADGTVLLAFQGRGTANKTDAWEPLQPFLVAVRSDGSTEAPEAVTSEGRSSSYPEVAAGTGGRAYLAWSAADGQGRTVLVSRARKKE
jgi:hypothetical protein